MNKLIKKVFSSQELEGTLVKTAASYAKTQGIKWTYGHTCFSRDGFLEIWGDYLVITHCEGIGDVYVTVNIRSLIATKLVIVNGCITRPLKENAYPIE